MLSAVENLGSAGAGPGRVLPYSRHHAAHQPGGPHQHHPAAPQHHHHAYHPLHTILSPSAIGGQLQLPPLLGAQSSLAHAMPTVGNEFVRPYPKQRYEENRCFGIPSALTAEQRLKYGDPPPASAPGTNVLIHPQTGPVNLAVSSNGGSGGAAGDDFGGSLTYTQSNPIQSDASKYAPGAATLQPSTYQQKFQQEQQHQQMLEFLGAQQQSTGNRMVCFPAMGSLDVFGGYSPMNYDMYPYRRVHGRPTYIPPPNHRPMEQRYTGGAATFLPPRAPPPSSDTSSTGGRLPKAAASPVAIKSKLWHMPLSPPAPPTPPSHHTPRDISLPASSSSSSNASITGAEVDTLVASYRALKSAQLQHAYHPRMWAPDPLQQPPANATYLNDLPSIAGPEEDKNGIQSYPLIAHSTPINHMPSLQDAYMASVQQRHRPKFGSMSATSTSGGGGATASMQQEFKVPLGMEGSQKQQRTGGSVRVEPPHLIGPYNTATHGAFDGAGNSSSRRSSYEIESHELLSEDGGAHQHILHTTVLKPKMFLRGSMIAFRNGVKKPVEQVRLEDFLRTAAISPDVRLTEALTRRITPRYSSCSSSGDAGKKILVRFTYDQQQRHGALETTMDYPFFVTTKGWTSHHPETTFKNYGLDCAPLEVGDVFIVLVPRHLTQESMLVSTQTTNNNTTTEQRSIDHFALQQHSVAEDEKKLHIANVFSLNPSASQCSPTEENALLQHHRHHRQQHGAEIEKELSEEQPQQRRQEESGGSSASASPTIMVEDDNHLPTTPPNHSWMTTIKSGGGSGGKRRQDGQRRASAKRKLTETQSQDVFRTEDSADCCSSIEHRCRTAGSTELVD